MLGMYAYTVEEIYIFLNFSVAKTYVFFPVCGVDKLNILYIMYGSNLNTSLKYTFLTPKDLG